MSDESFSEHPVSLSEVRAHQASDGALWSPRDALIDLLRLIDSGKMDGKIDQMVISYRSSEDGTKDTHRTSYSVACDCRTTAVGLLATVQHMILSR